MIAEINQALKSLEKEQIQINLKWTPGHADIAGNEIADQLAKTAAEEAERMPEVTNPVTALDIKTAVQESCNIKWQKRWEAGATGRQLFDLRPSVNVQTVPMQSIKTQRIISELRTGYCRLNEYRYKTGLQDSPNCKCGDPESVQHQGRRRLLESGTAIERRRRSRSAEGTSVERAREGVRPHL